LPVVSFTNFVDNNGFFYYLLPLKLLTNGELSLAPKGTNPFTVTSCKKTTELI